MHEHAGEVPEFAVRSEMLRPAGRAELAVGGSVAEPGRVREKLVNELARVASTLDPEDLRVLIALVRRLAAAKERQPWFTLRLEVQTSAISDGSRVGRIFATRSFCSRSRVTNALPNCNATEA